MSARLREAAALARTWRLHVAVLLAVAVAGVLSVAPGSAAVPQLRSVEIMRAPTASIAALVVTFGILLTLDEPVRQVPATTVRRLAAWRRSRVVAVTVAALAIMLVAEPNSPAATVTALAALVGEGLLCRVMVGPELPWLLPAAHLLAAVTFGATPERDVAVWAWIVALSPGPGEVALSLGLLGFGLAAWGRLTD